MNSANKYFRHILIIIPLLLLTEAPRAQDSGIKPSEGAFFALSARDLDRMINWYTEKLGFQILTIEENEIRKGALLSKEDCILEIAEFKDSRPGSALRDNFEPHQFQGIFKIGFIVYNIESLYNLFHSGGVEIFFPVVETETGYKTFGIKDPEGNIVQFFEKMEQF